MNPGIITKIRKNQKFIYYGLLLLAVIFLLCILLISSATIRKERKARIEAYTDRAAAELDERIEGYLYSFMESNLDRYMRQSTFSLFFERDTDFEVDFFTQMRISMVDSLRFHQQIKDITLYRYSDNAVISAMNSGFSLSGVNTSFDYVRSVLNTDLPDHPDFISPVSGESYYYYPIKSYQNVEEGVSSVGFALAQLRSPVDFFGVDINELNEKGTFVVLNQGDVLSVEGNDVLSTVTINEAIHGKSAMTLYSSTASDLPAPYTFYYVPSGVSKLVYVYYEPKAPYLFSISTLAEQGWMYPLLFSILCVLIFFTISMFFVHKAEKAGSADPAPARLFYASSAAALSRTLKDSFTDTPLPLFSCVLIQYHDNAPDRDASELKELIRASSEDYLTVCKLTHTVIIQQDYICCFLNYSDYNMKVLVKALIQLLYTTIETCDFNLYYTSAADSYSSLDRDVRCIRRLLHYTFILGYARTVSQDYLEKCEENPDQVDPNAICTIRKMLQEKHFDELNAYITEKKEAIKSGFYSYNAVHDFMEAAFYTMKSFFIDRSFSHPLTAKTSASVIGQGAGAEPFLDYLLECAASYREMAESSSTPHEQKYLEAIYQYVDSHLSTVTLNSMAEHFHVTPAHLSRLFKKGADINFSDYISEKKLQQAMQLLESDSGLNINEISKMLGYNTPAYFLTKFKERYGVTPSAYRKNYFAGRTNAEKTEEGA